jgi:triacylglycerol lipase
MTKTKVHRIYVAGEPPRQAPASDEKCKSLLSLSVPDLLLYFSDVSYHAYDTDMSGTLRKYFTEWKLIERDGAQGHVACSPYAVLLAFRGTEFTDPSDIAADLDTEKMDYNNGKVHRGFWREAEKLKPMVFEWILSHPNKPIIITGHSLGAAISLITARILEREMSCKGMNVITFGCPKIGDERFVNGIKSRHIRVCNENDVVPTIPSGKPWTHHGELVFLDGGRFRTDLVGKAVASARRKIGLIKILTCVPFSPFKAHLLHSYEGNITKAIKDKRPLNIPPMVYTPSFIPTIPGSLPAAPIDPLSLPGSFVVYDEK